MNAEIGPLTIEEIRRNIQLIQMGTIIPGAMQELSQRLADTLANRSNVRTVDTINSKGNGNGNGNGHHPQEA